MGLSVKYLYISIYILCILYGYSQQCVVCIYLGMDGYVLICRACDKNGDEGECGILMSPSYPIAE